MPRIKQPFPAFLLSHNNNLNKGYTKNLGLFCHKPYGREVENLQLWKILSIRNVFFWHVLSKKWHKQQKWAILKSFLKHLINSPLQYSFLVLWKYSSQNYGYFDTFTPKNKKTRPNSLFWTKFHSLTYENVILVKQDLSNIFAIFGFRFTTLFLCDLAITPTVLQEQINHKSSLKIFFSIWTKIRCF